MLRKTTPVFQEPVMEMEVQLPFISSSLQPDGTCDFQGTWNSNESFFFPFLFFLNEISTHDYLEYLFPRHWFTFSTVAAFELYQLPVVLTKDIKTTVEVHTVIVASEVLLIPKFNQNSTILALHFSMCVYIYESPWRCHTGKQTT